jgi:hypothetical protein
LDFGNHAQVNKELSPEQDVSIAPEINPFQEFSNFSNNWAFSKTTDNILSMVQPQSTKSSKPHKRNNSSGGSGNTEQKYVLGIKPELAELLSKFNEIPLDQLQKDIRNLEGKD